MSVKEMDTIQASSCENNLKQALKSNDCEPTNFRNNSHSVRILEDLQSLRKNEDFCDIRFKADDGKIVIGHKIVLSAASPYFRAIFSNFDESNKDLINIKELDSTILKLIVDYIYTGKIMVTKENVQALLSAANVLQLDYVNEACAEFLQKQLDPSNCIVIKAFADLHKCTGLLSNSEAYIKQHFLEVAKGEDFLSLSSEDLVKLVSSNDLAVPFEEKVFECVIKWIKHDLDRRNDFLPNLMEHVRLPLLKPDILFNIYEEPLLNTIPKCNNYLVEALSYNHQKSVQHFTIPKTIKFKPRQFGSQKVILMFNKSDTSSMRSTEWYDPATQLRENAPGINDCRQLAGLGVIRDQFVFVMGGVNERSSKSVGGARSGKCLKSVEYYDPALDTWSSVAEMSECRDGVSVGVLDGHMYAVGGYSSGEYLKSVEFYRPSDGVWSSVADMHFSRYRPGVATLDGLLYVFGGETEKSIVDTVEIYNPNTNTWTMETLSRHGLRVYSGVVVDRPHHYH
eukprot:XP_016660788.1 PREDICTED: ring canal kelch homolog isoform X3 [Acyrthosiphon pisum]